MTCLRLILGDQLHSGHSWFQSVDPDIIYVIMEVRSETDYVRHHAQKILAIFATMRAFAQDLQAKGHRVHYVKISDGDNRQSLADNLAWLCAHYKATRLEWQAPDEWRVDQILRDTAQTLALPGGPVNSEHFLAKRGDVARFFADRRQWLMEYFYRHMRRIHHILMEEDGKPVGGQWNYDAENRKAWQGTPPSPEDWRPVHDHSALWTEIVQSGADYFGNPQAAAFRWPLNRAEALQGLEAFVRQALGHFGTYQDAMHTEEPRLFHALISFALNVKMLHPREVIDAALASYVQGKVDIATVEGFVRQILGWREYVRGIYWAHMPGYADSNALGHVHALPAWFWTGKTDMACLHHAIGQSLETAYAHHIQRLMVIGNFALLAGLDPQALHRWYLGIYIDAFEWVEMPNTLGMSQYADDGLLASKPYVSSAAYVDRMSNYCRGCRYDRKSRTQETSCPFNALYWDFLARHRNRLASNMRMAMMFRQLDKMGADEQAAIAARADALRAGMDQL